jgi:hypothetical protein
MKKTFRGLLAHGDQARIRLSTNDGLTGYQIDKFQVITKNPASETAELVVKVYSVEQSTVDAVVNFDAPTLLAVAYYEGHSNSTNFGGHTIIIDSVKVNQDMYVTLSDGSGGSIGGNFYLELSQMKLDKNEATVATLKDMRGRE